MGNSDVRGVILAEGWRFYGEWVVRSLWGGVLRLSVGGGGFSNAH